MVRVQLKADMTLANMVSIEKWLLDIFYVWYISAEDSILTIDREVKTEGALCSRINGFDRIGIDGRGLNTNSAPYYLHSTLLKYPKTRHYQLISEFVQLTIEQRCTH